uniref:Uncharacterized protein n=1 Tax=Anguilla anguilla TaxID=7936 RepID=A0A0E9WCD8_ANGAN
MRRVFSLSQVEHFHAVLWCYIHLTLDSFKGKEH